MQRVAMLSVHTSPLAQPGSGDGGGMNVYVHALASALARAGVGVDVLTRAEHPEQPPVVVVEPGFRVLHVDGRARARPVPLHVLPELVGAVHRRRARVRSSSAARLRRAARELLGVGRGRPPAEARARPAARHHVPHARPREGRGRPGRRRRRCGRASRPRSCAAPISWSRRPTRSATSSCATTAPIPTRVEIVPPGRRPPGLLARRPRRGPARTLGLPDRTGRCCSSVGSSRSRAPTSRSRARRARRPAAPTLVIVGGPSGPDGDAELARAARARRRARARARACASSPPQPHEQLADLLPRRRRVRRAVARRVVRARRARGRRVRHAGRRRRRRRAALARRRRRHRLPRRRTRSRRLTPRRSTACCAATATRCARARVAARRGLPLEHRGGAASPSLRRPRRARARAVQLTSSRQLEQAHALIAAHLEGPVADESYIQHVEYDPELRRWYVRFTCDGRDATTIYFDLHERTLRYEVYFLPMPAGETTSSSTSSCCGATTRCTAPASRSGPTATCTSSGASRSSTSP